MNLEIKNIRSLTPCFFLADMFQIMCRPTKNKSGQLLQGHIQLTLCDKMECTES